MADAVQFPKRARTPLIPQLGRVADVDLMQVPALADCNPGIEPAEYNVVVVAATMPERVGSIFLPDEAQERMGDAIQVGRLLVVSPLAYNYDTWPEGTNPPSPGDVVWFAKFAGATFTGRDGKEYRLIKDKDVGAVVERAG